MHHRSALEQAEMLRARQVSAVELVEHHLGRIAEIDPGLAAFVEVRPERALRWARYVDVQLGRGRREISVRAQPFLGVPTAIKDSDALRGTFTRVGSRAFRYMMTPYDSSSAARFRRAGFVFTGKTATSELTLMPVTEPDIHAPTRNPWNTAHSSGGSSGGAAAAVAAGMLPLAHAADGGGSIRIPAAFCHLFGFKSSRAYPSFYGRMEPLHMASVGAMTHTVDDAAAILDVLAQSPGGGGRSMLEQSRAPLERGLRIGLLTRSPLTTVDPEIEAATRAVAQTLTEMGHHVEEMPTLDIAVEEFLPIYQRLAANAPILMEGVLQPVTRWLRDPGKSVPPRTALAIKNMLERRVLEWFGDRDLMVLPTVGRLAPDVGAWRHLAPAAQFAEAAHVGAFTAAFNVSGQPAANVPVELSSSGLPIGVQIVAAGREDARLLRACRAIETAMPWRARMSPKMR